MDKGNPIAQRHGGVKNVDTKLKSSTPAIIRMANYHGAKFPTNMTSENKKELFWKLEAWRKERREKLAASILAKQNQKSAPLLPLNKLPVAGGGSNLKKQTTNHDRQSVFERLYKNSGKNKTTVSGNCSKPQHVTKPTSKKGSLLMQETSNKPVKIICTGKRLETLPVTCVAVSEFTNQKGLINVPKKIEGERNKKVLRRSISMIFHQRCKTENAARRCISAKNLHEINLKLQATDFKSMQRDNFAVSKSKAVLKPMTVHDPKNTKLMTSAHLRTKLEDWLKSNGHSLDGYRHLRCFASINVENSVLEAPASRSDDPLEKSYCATPNTAAKDLEMEKENVTPPSVTQQVDVKDADNWLKELRRLIVEVKYPSERCEEWLAAIKKKCPSCSHLPIYWECLAALHESKGDLKSAIEDYERAIIKGGEVDVVGDSLAQIFDKMVIEQKKNVKPKLEKGLDPKNIFKSTIIKFALQQKAIKKLGPEIQPGVREQLYVATPVRRSSRIQTPLKSTDEVTSLQALTPEFRKNVTFKPNKTLLE